MSEECHYRTSDISTMADMTLLPQAKSFAPSRGHPPPFAFFFDVATSPRKLRTTRAACCYLCALPRLQIVKRRFAGLADFERAVC